MNPNKIKKERSPKAHDADPARNDTFNRDHKEQIKNKIDKIPVDQRRNRKWEPDEH